MRAMTRAKICGLTTAEAVQAALDGGAAYLGFVFFPKSPRNLDPETAARLAAPARGRTEVVAVTVDADDDTLGLIAATLRPDLIQLHGAETPARAHDVARRTGAKVIKAIPVSSADDLVAIAAYEGAVDHLMLDAKAPAGADLPGGNGARFDWSLPKDHRFVRPWFLAGGLETWNVAEAIAASGAPLVDVSSGVERGPGYKDPRLISAFLEAVRRA
jgi:phosphoribosylanthranilate isomerase